MEKDLVFYVMLKESDKAEVVVEEFGKRFESFEYLGLKERALVFRTDLRTYEKVFDTEVEYDEGQKKQQYFSAEGYRQNKIARVPEGLGNLINCVFLKKNRDKNYKMAFVYSPNRGDLY